MATQALYRRWRSQTFAEILGQDHVTHTLLNALRANRIAHAYLFSGPRGTGKTTTARVLAKAVNCLDPQNGEPCNRCTICLSLKEGRSLDLIEIDAASHTGVDDIRDLRDKIAFTPNECRYKVYVVDEVHMLSTSAFNALLKTLEEPPAHAIFVLATTEPEKIPSTVLSRCQRFDFRRVPLPLLLGKLELICEREELKAQPQALDAIARYASGSFRDAESLLDQLVSSGADEIALRDVRAILGSAPAETVAHIVQAAVSGDTNAGLQFINQALDEGVEPLQLTKDLLEYLRSLLVIKSGGRGLLQLTPAEELELLAASNAVSLSRLLRVTRLFAEAAYGQKPGLQEQLPLEMALVESTLSGGGPKGTEGIGEGSAASNPHTRVAESHDTCSPAKAGGASAGSIPGEAAESMATEDDASALAEDEPAGRSSVDSREIGLTWLQDNWGRMLAAMRPRNRMVEALLKSCEPVSAGNGLVVLGFYHSFHKERVGEDQNRAEVEQVLSELAGQPLRVKCSLWEGDRQGREEDQESSRREELLKNPVVREAVAHYGARVVDIH